MRLEPNRMKFCDHLQAGFTVDVFIQDQHIRL